MGWKRESAAETGGSSGLGGRRLTESRRIGEEGEGGHDTQPVSTTQHSTQHATERGRGSKLSEYRRKAGAHRVDGAQSLVYYPSLLAYLSLIPIQLNKPHHPSYPSVTTRLPSLRTSYLVPLTPSLLSISSRRNVNNPAGL